GYQLHDLIFFSGSATAECLTDSDPTGELYTGTQNVASKGEVCQRWDSQSPHGHKFTNLDGQANYCRNPDGERGPWCYTMDPEVRWAFCDIPSCNNIVGSAPVECLTVSDPSGELYTGTQNVTSTGDVCQRWDSQSPHGHGFTNLGDQANYCRNPDGERGPWCYTMKPEVRWALCDIPSC
ncbi:plasminogen-like, partial [Ostrea edulis]|uniref:plasminogen-like n=1 Tax=Ostrea edulis TaxID=37623 RepID=UPI0024AEECA1